jgi:hypothetical protein
MKRRNKRNKVALVWDPTGQTAEREIILTAADIAAIKIAEEQLDLGEGIDFREFAKKMRKKYGIKSPSTKRGGKGR